MVGLLSLMIAPRCLLAEQSAERFIIQQQKPAETKISKIACIGAWLEYSDCALAYGMLAGSSCKIEMHWALKCELRKLKAREEATES